MGGLPRPDLPPGPRRDLSEALHDLHHRAGWPSLRTLARERRLQPHHGLQGVLDRQPAGLGSAGAAGGGDARRHRTVPRALARREHPDRRQPPRRRAAADGRPRGRARRRSTPPRVRHRHAAGHRRGRHRQDQAGHTAAAWPAATPSWPPAPASRCPPRSRCSDRRRAAHDPRHRRRPVDQGGLGRVPALRPRLTASLLPELDGRAPPEPEENRSRQRLFVAIGSALRRSPAAPARGAHRGPALG